MLLLVRKLLACCLVGLLGVACARSSSRATAPEQRAPVVIPSAPDAGPTDEPRAELPRRSELQRGDDERGEDVQIEVVRDAGSFSFRAHTVRDAGFSFRVGGSISVSTDGGSVSVTISPDAGSP